MESVDINEPTIETQNPDLYYAYLQNLRTYKGIKHKVVFGWFDNSEKTPVSQAQNISAVPDSIDFLVLSDPMLNEREKKEVSDNLELKATRALYEINCDTLSSGQIQERLACYDDFYGIVFTFSAQPKMYMTDEEKSETQAKEQTFVNAITSLKNQHPNKMVVIKGMPQNLDDKSVLSLADYIILPCEDAVGKGDVLLALNKVAQAGITDKLVPMVSLYSLDTTDTKTGYWDSTYAAIGLANMCTATYDSYTIAGIALDNISNDYYHSNFVYPTVREAIGIIN